MLRTCCYSNVELLGVCVGGGRGAGLRFNGAVEEKSRGRRV